MPAAIHLDLSELVARPLRSGIQRIEREAIRHWPGPAPLVPCCVDNEGRFLRLPQAVLDVLCAEDDDSPAAREAERLALTDLASSAAPLQSDAVERLLNLELFSAASRADTHVRFAAAGVRVLWYLCDFLPFLRPDMFEPGTSRHCMHFLRGLRAAHRVAFLSEQTRHDFTQHIVRNAPPEAIGPVLMPGADGFRLEQQTFSPGRRDFVTIGTVEPRKNPDALLSAFEMLWQAGTAARLVVAGRISPDAQVARAFFERHANNPNLMVLDQPSDETLRKVLRRARIVVMPSEAEGFGLPPYEALHAGIPAIASVLLPSVASLPSGVMLLERMDAASISAAVASLLDDATASRLWQQTGDMRLPTWESFSHELGDWAQAA